MSQHLYATQCRGTPVTVLMGWDRPLGHYFLVIERDGADDPLYSNLDEPDAFNKSLDDLHAVLVEHEIEVPPAMFEQVWFDSMNKVGNRQVIYQADGTFQG